MCASGRAGRGGDVVPTEGGVGGANADEQRRAAVRDEGTGRSPHARCPRSVAPHRACAPPSSGDVSIHGYPCALAPLCSAPQDLAGPGPRPSDPPPTFNFPVCPSYTMMRDAAASRPLPPPGFPLAGGNGGGDGGDSGHDGDDDATAGSSDGITVSACSSSISVLLFPAATAEVVATEASRGGWEEGGARPPPEPTISTGPAAIAATTCQGGLPPLPTAAGRPPPRDGQSAQRPLRWAWWGRSLPHRRAAAAAVTPASARHCHP